MQHVLGAVERKVLGALMMLAGGNTSVNAPMNAIADKMGYKTSGGAITYALRILERDNFIAKTGKSNYKLLI